MHRKRVMSGHPKFHTRKFIAADLDLYRIMRLEALQLDPGMFGSNFAREASFTDEQWLARLTNDDSACFGLFCDDELIGITGAVVDKEDPSLAHMTQSYIRRSHRGRGLSRLLYAIRIEWAKQRGLKTLRTGHKESNLASKAANQRHGFIHAYREPTEWPDGSMEDLLYYHLDLAPDSSEQSIKKKTTT